MFEGHKKKELEKEPHVLSNTEANSTYDSGGLDESGLILNGSGSIQSCFNFVTTPNFRVEHVLYGRTS